MNGMNKFGIGFWSGAAIYSIINMILNLNQVDQTKILNYNYIITAVAIIGLILNIILLKRVKQWYLKTKDIWSGVLVFGLELV